MFKLTIKGYEDEPYFCSDYDEVHAAVREEARNTVDELGSAILEDSPVGNPAGYEATIDLVADAAMSDLWWAPDLPSFHKLPCGNTLWLTVREED